MALQGIDCASTVTATVAAALKSQGIGYVGRYLGNSWKCMQKAEADTLKAAGLNIISIFEGTPTTRGYFTAAQGKSDAATAISYAKAVGQPSGTAIYFTVDYPALDSDYSVIEAYFNVVKSNLGDYKMGAYGHYGVVEYLHSKGVADYYMQTIAWSGGKEASEFINVWQHQEDVAMAGIQVDQDQILKDPGAWGQDVPAPAPAPKPKPEPTPVPKPVVVPATYTVKAGDTLSKICAKFGLNLADVEKWNNLTQTQADLIQPGEVLKLKAPAPAKPTVPSTYTVKAGDTLSEICAKYGLDLAKVESYNHLVGNSVITPGEVIYLKGPKPAPAPTTKKITVKAGDTLSDLAVEYHTTVAELQKLNGLTKTEIFIGQVLKVPTSGGSSSSKTYKIEPGDNLTEIAAKFETTVAEILKLNRIANEDKIYTGQVIRVK